MTNYKDIDITYKQITITEVKRVIKSLKVGKSCGTGLIVTSGFDPETWLNSYIVPLIKGDDPLDPNN